MKAFTRALIVLSLSIICILNIGLVSAVEQGEISVVPSWSDSTPYQGDTVTVTLRLTSTSSEQLKIYRVGLHFDWMPEGSFFTLDLTDDPVTVPATGTHVTTTRQSPSVNPTITLVSMEQSRPITIAFPGTLRVSRCKF